MKSNYKRLGDYIKLVDKRNQDLKNDNLRAISVSKKFIATKSDKEDLNLSGYKIIKPRQFGYVTVTSRNGEKISIAILEDEPCIVSSTYIVFEVIDQDVLLPEFLFLWFKRPEFDRHARFHSWGSARETFDWDDMCNLLIPIPDIDQQRKIVAVYNALRRNQRFYEQSLDDLQLICESFMASMKKKYPHERLGKYIDKLSQKNNNDSHKAVSSLTNDCG